MRFWYFLVGIILIIQKKPRQRQGSNKILNPVIRISFTGVSLQLGPKLSFFRSVKNPEYNWENK